MVNEGNDFDRIGKEWRRNVYLKKEPYLLLKEAYTWSKAKSFPFCRIFVYCYESKGKEGRKAEKLGCTPMKQTRWSLELEIEKYYCEQPKKRWLCSLVVLQLHMFLKIEVSCDVYSVLCFQEEWVASFQEATFFLLGFHFTKSMLWRILHSMSKTIAKNFFNWKGYKKWIFSQ